MLDRLKRNYEYCTRGVWNDTRQRASVKVIKVLNLTVSSFLNKKLQRTAAALTCSTLLALVPALAMIFAICRGFGFENLLQTELFRYLPAQREVLEKVFGFVDSYLEHSSQGVFIGVGVAVLLFTVLSLIGNVEDALNDIFDTRRGRSLYRKLTDYTSIILLLPILIICDGGISLLMTSASDSIKVLAPVWNVVLTIAPYLLMSLFFIGVFTLIPHAKVSFKHAIVPGILCGLGFQLLQWLFVTGQIYVSKYNAIYGSFAFIPLLLVWMQLVWIMTLTGATLTFASQNVFRFDYKEQVDSISHNYLTKVAVKVMAALAHRFEDGESPYSTESLAEAMHLPIRLATAVTERLETSNLVSRVKLANGDDAIQPSRAPQSITVATVVDAISDNGSSDFLTDFDCTLPEMSTPILDVEV